MELLNYMGIYVEYEDVYTDKPLTLEQITDYFSLLNKEQTIQTLAKLNIALWKEKNNAKFQLSIAELFFNEAELQSISKAVKKKSKEGKVFLFSRKQLLLAMKLLLLAPSKSSNKPNNKELGKILLSISSNLEDPLPKTFFKGQIAKGILEAYTKLYPFYNKGKMIHNVARNLYFWTDLLSSEEGKNILSKLSFDPLQHFQKTFGISVEEFMMLTFTTLARLDQLDILTEKPENFIMYPNFFENTAIDPNTIDNMYAPITINVNDVKETNKRIVKDYLNETPDIKNNFILFQENPYIGILTDLKIVCDPVFLEERMATAPYYLVLNDVYKDKAKRIDMGTLYGDLLELYIKEILESLFDNVIKLPESSSPTPDFLCIKDDIGYVIEAKKVAIPFRMQFTGRESDIEKLLIDSEAKDFTKKSNFPKGFYQIYSLIDRLDEQDYLNLNLTTTLVGKIESLTKVYPMLITDSSIPDHPELRLKLENELFTKLKKGKYNTLTVAEPVFISIQDLEVIECICYSENVNTLFEEYNALYRSRIDNLDFIMPNGTKVGVFNIPNKIIPMWHFLHTKYGKYCNNQRLKKFFDRKFDEYKKLLFP
ncbi:MAG: hypothetical protein R3B92_02930 [Patescibacteria group bacterium]